jgi:hypothetical protein
MTANPPSTKTACQKKVIENASQQNSLGHCNRKNDECKYCIPPDRNDRENIMKLQEKPKRVQTAQRKENRRKQQDAGFRD